MFLHEKTKRGRYYLATPFYLALPLPLVAGYMPTVTFGATINVHVNACGYPTFVGDDYRL